MNQRAVRGALVLVVVPALAALAGLTLSVGGVRSPFSGSAGVAPRGEPVLESFSVADGDPLTATGIHPADILIEGPLVAIPCSNLGLICLDPATGANDDLSSLAYDYDFLTVDLPPVEFSVAPGSAGAAGSAVAAEAACAPVEAAGDVFETLLTAGNTQDVDGDGSACTVNAGLGIGLDETAPGLDNLDALERDPYQYVDLDRNGVPEAPVFFTLAPGSPSLSAYGAGPADILLTVGGGDPIVWASSTDLGLTAGDVIDSLCLDDDEDGVFGLPGDRVLFSLAPGSPTLASLPAGPGDILRPGPAIQYQETSLGLLAGDDVDALKCAADDTDRDIVFDFADNCPAWPNATQALPPWPVSAGDADCDGFTNAAESTLGTDPVDQCPDDASDDAWPPDINKTMSVSVTDVLFLKAWFGQDIPPAPVRYDLVPTNSINITDVIEFKKYFGLNCT